MVKELFNDEQIKASDIGIKDQVLIPAVNGRRQKKRHGYGEVIDKVTKQSGETVFLIYQAKGRFEFTLRQLKEFWTRCSALLPRVSKP